MTKDPKRIVSVFMERPTQMRGITADGNIVTASNYGSPVVSLTCGMDSAVVITEDGQKILFDYETGNDHSL